MLLPAAPLEEPLLPAAVLPLPAAAGLPAAPVVPADELEVVVIPAAPLLLVLPAVADGVVIDGPEVMPTAGAAPEPAAAAGGAGVDPPHATDRPRTPTNDNVPTKLFMSSSTVK